VGGMPIVINLLAGSLLGAGWATRLTSLTLYCVIAILLVVIAIVLLLDHTTSAIEWRPTITRDQ
jgi:uncharacterized protein